MRIVSLHVVGTTFADPNVYHDFTYAAEKNQVSAQRLSIKPDPTNIHDENAIAVLFDGERLGYISKESAANVSRLINTRNFTVYTVDNVEVFSKDDIYGLWIDISLNS